MNQRFRRQSASCGPRIEPRAGADFPAIIGPSRRAARQDRRGGFTLVELLTVMIIIAIILSFVFTAGMDAVRRAEERATQALIAKLEGGLNDRVEALLETRPDYNLTHLYLANVYNGTNNLTSIRRAQVIAWLDYVKAEMPDVFFVQTDANYPLNFAANQMPGTDNSPNVVGGGSGTLGAYANYVLPIGNTLVNNSPASLGDGNATNPDLGIAGTGIYGASYSAAAGIYKNLGYTPTGCDGVDNDGNGLVDEHKEGVSHGPPWTADPVVVAHVTANLGNHKHITARAEMLYALLVEGSGPLGSVFSADEFTSKEVQDTDGDGLPEFVDAWGQPIQFFRWPLLYSSDIQRGQVVAGTNGQSWQINAPYASVFQTREQDPLDLNQQLMAPAWWTAGFNNSTPTGMSTATLGSGLYSAMTPAPSAGVQAIEYFFHRITEPISGAGGINYWDRGTTYGSRRAFYSKFLIVSGGPDVTPGVFLYPDSTVTTASQLIANENNAMPFALDVVDFTTSATFPTTIPAINQTGTPASFALQQAAQDDISNQNLAATGAIGGSG
jgi:prepilin-type N-terminal cleavage/methylation domain-containing protein